MDTPFAFGKQVTENYFPDRQEDCALIRSHLSNRVNTILISPRRCGKSSLIRQLGIDMMRDDPSVHFIHIDLYSIRSEEDFFRVYANTVLKVMATLGGTAGRHQGLSRILYGVVARSRTTGNEIRSQADYCSIKFSRDSAL